jgi:hypothetical protein
MINPMTEAEVDLLADLEEITENVKDLLYKSRRLEAIANEMSCEISEALERLK